MDEHTRHPRLRLVRSDVRTISEQRGSSEPRLSADVPAEPTAAKSRSGDARPRLELLTAPPTLGAPDTMESSRAAAQLELLSPVAAAGPSLLGFFQMYEAHGDSFACMIEQVRPAWVFDLRALPSFYLLRLNRRRAIHLFRRCRVSYCSANKRFDLWDRHDPRLGSGEIAQALNGFVNEPELPGMRGPIICLVDDEEVLATCRAVFPNELQPAPRGGWRTHVFDNQARVHV